MSGSVRESVKSRIKNRYGEGKEKSMTKRYGNLALIYSITAMVFGVFYREFTKFRHFSGLTNLSVIHTHYFLLGMFFFLLLMAVEKVFSFTGNKVKKCLVFYQIGINITALGFLLRGLAQVLGTQLSRGMDASISGIAGIGHLLTGVSMVLILLEIRKKAV